MRRTARVHPGEDDDIFKIRFRNTPPAKSESMGGWGRGWSARFTGATKTARTAQRGFNPGAGGNLKQQRVTVKTSYHKMRGVRGAVAHARYLEGEHKDRAQAFDHNRDVDGQDLARRWTDASDQRHFRFIVTPERADIGDMQSFTRELMQRVEHDLGTRLEWYAVAHDDSGKPHAHVMLRGRDQNGEHLRINGKYLSHGIREHAQAIATQRLGERSRDEIERGIERSKELKEMRERGRELVGRALERGDINAKQAKELDREMRTAEPDRVQRQTEQVRERMQERDQQREQLQQEMQRRTQERTQERERLRDRGRDYGYDMGY